MVRSESHASRGNVHRETAVAPFGESLCKGRKGANIAPLTCTSSKPTPCSFLRSEATVSNSTITRDRPQQHVARLRQPHELAIKVERPSVHIGAEIDAAGFQGPEDPPTPPHIVGRVEIAKHLDRIDEVERPVAGG